MSYDCEVIICNNFGVPISYIGFGEFVLITGGIYCDNLLCNILDRRNDYNIHHGKQTRIGLLCWKYNGKAFVTSFSVITSISSKVKRCIRLK